MPPLKFIRRCAALTAAGVAISGAVAPARASASSAEEVALQGQAFTNGIGFALVPTWGGMNIFAECVAAYTSASGTNVQDAAALNQGPCLALQGTFSSTVCGTGTMQMQGSLNPDNTAVSINGGGPNYSLSLTFTMVAGVAVASGTATDTQNVVHSVSGIIDLVYIPTTCIVNISQFQVLGELTIQ